MTGFKHVVELCGDIKLSSLSPVPIGVKAGRKNRTVVVGFIRRRRMVMYFWPYYNNPVVAWDTKK